MKKWAVIGGGAIGSLVAGRCVQSGVDPKDMVLIGRPDHVRAIQKEGLTLVGSKGKERVALCAAERLKEVPDVAVFSVKTQDLEAAYQDNVDFLQDPRTRVLTTQNGVQADNILSTHFEPHQMISSIVMFGATYVSPGEVVDNFPGDWILGKRFTPNDQDVHQVAEFLGRAFPVHVTPNILGMKWLKLFVNFNNCLPALIGRSMQETFADIDFCRLSVLLLKEGIRIVREAKIELCSLPSFPRERVEGLAAMPVEQGAAIIQKTLTTLSEKPLYGSILQSILRKKPSEIDFINGEVVFVAKQIHQTCPFNTKVVEMVHAVEETGRFFTPEDVKKAFEPLGLAAV